MPFGLLISFACHALLLAWAVFSVGARELPTPDTPAISAEIITPSDFLRLKQGSEDSKHLETKAKEEPKPDDSKNDTKKPDNAPPPPPPQEVAKVEPPPPPEPPKLEPPKPPEPDPIAQKIDEPPPPPEPAPGPTPDEQKLLEQKIEEQRKADETKKKADEAHKKKLADELKKKKLAEEAKKKAEEAKKKFDASKLANLIEKAPDDASPKALIDKDPRLKGQQAAGTSHTATQTGKEAGTTTGTDTVLSAREQDLLKGLLKSQLQGCWRLPGAGGGTDTPVVTLRWKLQPDGSLAGEPTVQSAPGGEAGQVAAEAALRAVKTCVPFRLPADQYDGWKDVIWVFDPRQML